MVRGRRKLTLREYIERARDKHGDTYDYSNVVYKGAHEKVEIICRIHGSFWQDATSHISTGVGCPPCSYAASADKRRKPLDRFITDAQAVHGTKYDYGKVKYTNAHEKVEIICSISDHGAFWQAPSSHPGGQGCPTCGILHLSQINRSSLEHFIKRCQAKHGDKYDYSRVEYKNSLTKVEIYCRECRETFWQSAGDHGMGLGCQVCGKKRTAEALRLTDDQFVAKARATHGNKYDYSRVEYKNSSTKVEIYCTECKVYFWQAAASHTNGSGCPECHQSYGEAALTWSLKERKIPFDIQQKYPEALGQCAYDVCARPGHRKLLIEFDGGQHFRKTYFHPTPEIFQAAQDRDLHKTLFALDKGIPLLRLDYTTLRHGRIADCLDAALDSTAKLILSDAYHYRKLIREVLTQRPNAKIEVLYDSTPAPHSDWSPEEIELIRSELPDLDLSVSIAELDCEDLWGLVELTGNTTCCSPRSSASWLREVLYGLPPGFGSALTVATGELADYILAVM